MSRLRFVVLWAVAAVMLGGCAMAQAAGRSNFVFIFVDDLRYDMLGIAQPHVHTPNLDAIAERGLRFDEAFAVLSVCSPSRATVLTGRYPSSHGVTTYGNTPLRAGNPSFVHAFKAGGYKTGVTGKWHLGTTPQGAGFEWADTFEGNGRWYGRTVIEQGVKKKVAKYIEAWVADRSIAFIERAVAEDRPFILWHCTQVPHMTSGFDWPAKAPAMAKYERDAFELPASYPPDHVKTGKPPYLKDARSYTKAMGEYGYRDPEKLRTHMHQYAAAVTEMDAEVGRVINKLDSLGITDRTYVVFMSDNGWQLGEHGLTSKVLMYDKSMKVPLVVAGPGIKPGRTTQLVHNADLAPTLMALAGVEGDYAFHGESFVDMLHGKAVEWRDAVYYESPTPQLVPRPFYGLRTERYLYIETYGQQGRTRLEFVELYDVKNDPHELVNLALDAGHASLLAEFKRRLEAQRRRYGSL